MTQLYPMRFVPVYKDYIWGGDRILRVFSREQEPGVYAESWEVSDRIDGMSVVANGPLKGETLHELMKTRGEAILGKEGDRFPLLIKLIDANQNLSVQVHPDDQSAIKQGAEAKTEMWYVLDADENGAVYAGLKKGVDKKILNRAIEENRVPEVLEKINVKKDDVIYIPGGTVHAICEGCLLLEVQQNSNTTYRIYDWDRVGADGKRRPLHLKESFEVINWNTNKRAKIEPKLICDHKQYKLWNVLKTPYFEMQRIDLEGDFIKEIDGFQVFFVLEGKAKLFDEVVVPGMTYLVPSSMGKVELVAVDKPCQVLRVFEPVDS